MNALTELAGRRKRCFRNIATATCVGIFLAGIIILAAIDTRWSMPQALRWSLFASGIGALAILWIKSWRAARAERTPQEAARIIEASRPALGQKLRTALELTETGTGLAAGEHAETFATAIKRDSELVLADPDCQRLIPLTQFKKFFALSAALGLVLVTLLSIWPDFRLGIARVLAPPLNKTYTELEWNLPPSRFDERHPPRLELSVGRRLAEPTLFVREEGAGNWQKIPLSARDDGQVWDTVLTGMTANFQAYARAGDARTETIDVSYQPVPKLTESEVVIDYPDYIDRETETLPGGDLSSVEGSQATWNFTFNTQPETILWSVDGSKPEQLQADAENRCSASWTLPVGKFNATLSVADSAGEIIDAWRFEAVGIEDKLPKVEIVEPAKDFEATSVAEVPVRIRAKDDYGVGEIGLVLEAAGETDWVLEAVVDASNQRQINEMVFAMLEKVPLTLRDNVRMHAYALDRKPRGGPRAVSALRSIDIRDFKQRWIFLNQSGQPGGGPSEEEMQEIGEKIVKLNELIEAQRGVVSDTFVLKGGQGGNPGAPPAETREIAGREMQVASDTSLMSTQWQNDDSAGSDDFALLDIASSQMMESYEALSRLNLETGFDGADDGLTSLIQLRKKFLTILMKSNQPGQPMEGQPPQIELDSLIAEAERLAKEEADVNEQVMQKEGIATKPEITQRQQEVAVADAGELYAKLIAHPERTDGAVQLMDEAERAMIEAEKQVRSDEPTDASEPLLLAEQRLIELADFLRAIDMERLAETMRQLAQKAEENGEELAEAAKKPAEKKEGEGEGEGEKKGEGEAEKLAKGEGEGEEKGAGKGQGKASGESKVAEKAARDAEMVEEILKELARKAGGGEGENEGDEPDKGPGINLDKLREKLGAAALAQELLRHAEKAGEGEGGEDSQELAGELGKMAGEMRKFADRLDASKLAKLAEAKKEAGEVRDAIDKKTQQANAAQLREAMRRAAADEPVDDSVDPFGDIALNDENEGEKPGEDPGESEENRPGRGNPLGDPNEERSGAGPTLERFADTLDSIDDPLLNRWAMQIRPMPFDRNSIPYIDAIEEQLDQMIVEMPKNATEASVRGSVPEDRRREIEDYYRSLSDDFGGEVWQNQP